MAVSWEKLNRTYLWIWIPLISIGIGYALIAATTIVTINRTIPEFELIDLESEDALFSNTDLPNTPFLINAWASWCIPCRTEYSTLRDLKQRNKIDIYGLNYKDHQSDAIRWLNFYGSIYSKNGYDGSGNASNALDITVVPTSLLFNARQEMIYKHVGPLTEEIVRDILVPRLESLENDRLEK